MLYLLYYILFSIFIVQIRKSYIMKDLIEELWLYNNWANSLILNNIMPNAEQFTPRCLRLFSHIINTKMIWTSRITEQRGVESARFVRF